MLLSLVDTLRCPNVHDESSLVLTVEAWSGARVAEGVLGCPLCHARFTIHQGSVDFTGAAGVVRRGEPAVPPDAMRLAAQLSLSERGGLVLLSGRYAGASDALIELAGVTCLLVDAPRSAASGSVNVDIGDRLPLVGRALRGAAVDSGRATASFLFEVGRCLRPLGRMVAPSSSTPPIGCHVLARDTDEWVAEIDELSAPLPLRRESRS